MPGSAFDRLALDYDRWFDTHPHVFQSELNAIHRLLPASGEILEIGVGTGRFADRLNVKIGIEPSATMLHIAVNRGVPVVQANAERLPFKDAQFDIALSITTECFLSSPQLAYREIFRVLRQNGHVLIAMLNRDSPLVREYETNRQRSAFYHSANFYRVEEIVHLLESVGFKEFRFTETLFGTLPELKREEPIQTGYGEGGFVVIRATKPCANSRMS